MEISQNPSESKVGYALLTAIVLACTMTREGKAEL